MLKTPSKNKSFTEKLKELLDHVEKILTDPLLLLITTFEVQEDLGKVNPMFADTITAAEVFDQLYELRKQLKKTLRGR